jgi:hypothetical protein
MEEEVVEQGKVGEDKGGGGRDNGTTDKEKDTKK